MRRSLTLVVALVGTLAPRRLLRLNARLNLVGYRTTGEIEPKNWLVTATRLGSALTLLWLLATGGTDQRLTEEADVDAETIEIE